MMQTETARAAQPEVVRYMQEIVAEGADPFAPGEGNLTFEAREAPYEPAVLITDEQRDKYLADKLGIDLDVLELAKPYATVFETSRTAAVVVFRPAAIEALRRPRGGDFDRRLASPDND